MKKIELYVILQGKNPTTKSEFIHKRADTIYRIGFESLTRSTGVNNEGRGCIKNTKALEYQHSTKL